MPLFAHGLDTTRNAVQCIAHGHGESTTWLGQLHATTPAMEQRHAEFALQRPHLVADGTMGDVQFVAGTGEILVPCRRLEGAQCDQRRKTM
jgi:hypothetical protein